jgi:GT2 family glycosyltransferase
MKLSVVIVSYNVRSLLEDCLRSVQKAMAGLEGEVIVIDNNSSDGTVGALQPLFPDVRFVANKDNKGFARANNQAIRMSDSEYVLLLNPDTVVYENTLRGCVDFLDSHPEAGGVGVRMLTREGKAAPESRRAVPTPWVAFLKMLGCSKRYYMSHLSWDQPGQIEVISGAYCMLRRQALDQIGLLDEDFFMYGEDIDLSYRLLKGGWQNWYLPFDIIHYKGESTQKTSFRYVHVFYQAMLIFFRKHYGHLSLLLSLPIQIAIYFRAGVALMQMMVSRLRHFLNPNKKQ